MKKIRLLKRSIAEFARQGKPCMRNVVTTMKPLTLVEYKNTLISEIDRQSIDIPFVTDQMEKSITRSNQTDHALSTQPNMEMLHTLKINAMTSLREAAQLSNVLHNRLHELNQELIIVNIIESEVEYLSQRYELDN